MLCISTIHYQYLARTQQSDSEKRHCVPIDLLELRSLQSYLFNKMDLLFQSGYGIANCHLFSLHNNNTTMRRREYVHEPLALFISHYFRNAIESVTIRT